MMGRQSRQMAMVFVDMESLIPENHLLRKIDRMVSFDFIYELLAPYYSATGRPSVDPVSMLKMLLVGYLYGIKSERRLVEEIRLNIAYRWFCGFELDDATALHNCFHKYHGILRQREPAAVLAQFQPLFVSHRPYSHHNYLPTMIPTQMISGLGLYRPNTVPSACPMLSLGL